MRHDSQLQTHHMPDHGRSAPYTIPGIFRHCVIKLTWKGMFDTSTNSLYTPTVTPQPENEPVDPKSEHGSCNALVFELPSEFACSFATKNSISHQPWSCG